MMRAPASLRPRGETALTAPAVPTGMNTGVGISPWAVRSKPARARDAFSPEPGGVVWISKNGGMAGFNRPQSCLSALEASSVDRTLASNLAGEKGFSRKFGSEMGEKSGIRYSGAYPDI